MSTRPLFRSHHADARHSGNRSREEIVLRLPFPVFKPPLNLADYIGLEMRVRTSNHGYIFNIHPDNMVPSDLFQGFIVIPHRDWAIIQLPFANMAYTGYG